MFGIAINGWKSAIAQAFILNWTSPSESVILVNRGEDMPHDRLRYLFCQGVLNGKRVTDQSTAEITESYFANYMWIASQCRKILDANAFARICVIGSESAFTGSYDQAYADHKRYLHQFVERYALRPKQQLICIAPTIIGDAGMTTRRTDTDNLERRRLAHPQERFLTADEVAGLIHHVLYIDRGYLSGVTIRMNGGAHCGKAAQERTDQHAAPCADVREAHDSSD